MANIDLLVLTGIKASLNFKYRYFNDVFNHKQVNRFTH